MQLEIGKTYTLKHDTKARCKVLGEVTGHDSPKLYWVEISGATGWLTHIGKFFSNGERDEGVQKAWQLMEIPPKPVKKEGWVSLVQYGEDKNKIGLEGFWTSKKDLIKNYSSIYDFKLLGCKKIIITEGEFDE